MASGQDWVLPEDTSLGYISTLFEKFQIPIGFIDHTPFEWMPAVAVASGAKIISKHLSPSSLYKGPDWQICLEPAKMKEAIQNARAVFESLSVNDKKLAKGEDLDKKVMRRSLVSAKVIKKGELFTFENITFKRPGIGISIDNINKFIRKKALANIDKDIILTLDMVENDG